MTAVRRWTGKEARALRAALRLSVRAFADHLGVSARAISKWEASSAATFPRPDTQAILDTALSRADEDAHQRFEMLTRSTDSVVARAVPRGPKPDYETWEDDLERSAIALSCQDFPTAATLMERWLPRFTLNELDERGRYLRGRSLVLLGGVRRDQGVLTGPKSATSALVQAREIFEELDIPRRVAQADLALTVLKEMSGDLTPAIVDYRELGVDGRLRDVDRTLARVWAGRALSKLADPDSSAAAIDLLTNASASFERQDEAGYWAFAQQKLALSHRGCGDLARANQQIGTVIGYRVTASPLQHVRLLTAHAHILSSDGRSGTDGDMAFDKAHRLAAKHGLGHQLTSIAAIRSALDKARSS